MLILNIIQVQQIADSIIFMSWMYGYRFRVLLVIDDLDRCEPERIMKVLEALNLLLEPMDSQIDNFKSPFISVVAVDHRIVLGAIERYFDPDNRRDISHANVNG